MWKGKISQHDNHVKWFRRPRGKRKEKNAEKSETAENTYNDKVEKKKVKK